MVGWMVEFRTDQTMLKGSISNDEQRSMRCQVLRWKSGSSMCPHVISQSFLWNKHGCRLHTDILTFPSLHFLFHKNLYIIFFEKKKPLWHQPNTQQTGHNHVFVVVGILHDNKFLFHMDQISGFLFFFF